MRVLSIAYPFASVSPDAVGGAEQILSILDRAIVREGHRSFVIAAAGSRVDDELIALPSFPGEITGETRKRMHACVAAATRAVLAKEPIDLIHCHGIDFLDYLPPPGPPLLITMHLPLSWYPPEIFELTRPRTYMQCVSHSQRATAPADWLTPIENGVDLEAFRPAERKSEFALLLARICPEKGIDTALRACRAANLPLRVGGEVYPYPEHREYFAERVEPLLDRERQYLGPLSLSSKAQLLAEARYLLSCSTAPETSSLVAMEALASGTPVLGLRSGALPEIIEDGSTGKLVGDESELTEVLLRRPRFSPEACRAAAEARFDARRMTDEYLALYRRL